MPHQSERRHLGERILGAWAGLLSVAFVVLIAGSFSNDVSPAALAPVETTSPVSLSGGAPETSEDVVVADPVPLAAPAPSEPDRSVGQDGNGGGVDLNTDGTGGFTETEWGWVARMAEVGERQGFEEIIEFYGRDPRLSPMCHQLVHELGRQSFVRHQSLAVALEFETDWCGAGFTHGVMEMWGRQAYVEGSERSLADECIGTGLVGPQVCGHGVGHAVMQDDPGLQVAFERCARLDQQLVWDCIDGVMMLYSQTYMRPESSDGGDDGFSVNEFCGLMPDGFVTNCQWIAGAFWLGVTGNPSRPQALEQCLSLVGDEFASLRCAHGVGETVPDVTGWDPVAARDECGKGPDSLRDVCTQAAWRVLSMFMEQDGQGELCAKLPVEQQQACRDALANPLMNRNAGAV